VLPICSSETLDNGGRGFRFTVLRHGVEEPAFVIRYQDRVYAYLNKCAHVPTQLDWVPGSFFDSSGRRLICSTHGALYSPSSGRCIGGHCSGKGLVSLPVTEKDGQVYLLEV
jgi:nitrite reductase/ring-hydroxylating ferredoxin subunit